MKFHKTSLWLVSGILVLKPVEKYHVSSFTRKDSAQLSCLLRFRIAIPKKFNNSIIGKVVSYFAPFFKFFLPYNCRFFPFENIFERKICKSIVGVFSPFPDFDYDAHFRVAEINRWRLACYINEAAPSLNSAKLVGSNLAISHILNIILDTPKVFFDFSSKKQGLLITAHLLLKSY